MNFVHTTNYSVSKRFVNNNVEINSQKCYDDVPEGGMTMKRLYLNIKNRRLELGMSQEELARKVGYTDRSSIAKIETGKVDISVNMLQKIAAALDTDPLTLLEYLWEVEE